MSPQQRKGEHLLMTEEIKETISLDNYRPGATLANGATIIAVLLTAETGIILADTEKGRVTWALDIASGATYWGHYFQDEYWGHYFQDDDMIAHADFLNRCTNLILTNMPTGVKARRPLAH